MENTRLLACLKRITIDMDKIKFFEKNENMRIFNDLFYETLEISKMNIFFLETVNILF